MNADATVLGIDIGSVAVAVAVLNAQKKAIQTAYAFHHGNIADTFRDLVKSYEFKSIRWVAATASTPDRVRATQRYDNRLAVMAASRNFHGEVGSILIIGGEKFGLIRFDPLGNYIDFRSNSSCAAGTGSFLDQQAERLNLDHVAALSRVACGNTGRTPKIATRCAVFAKTDLVHAQQEGYTLPEICDGLCLGLAKNVVDTLFVRKGIHQPVIFTGGVAQNRAVVKHIQSLIGMQVVPETFPYGAVGAALCLMEEPHRFKERRLEQGDDLIRPKTFKRKYFFPPLKLNLSEYPEFGGLEQYLFHADPQDEHNPVEVEIFEPLDRFRSGAVSCGAFIGMDVGSTSTKAVLVDPSRVVLAGFYTRTAGRPVQAFQNLFSAIEDFAGSRGIDLRILGAGTTGSGRKISGRIIGADVAVDEITAHARAACEIHPEVDTILEIGGQDSKFTTLKNGRVTFSVMNTVCAAGTGSFIEEQAKKLQCPLAEYSKRTQGKKSPIVSDRCTVFMERDINYYLSGGYEKDEVLASALHAIRENYLSKVAIQKSIGKTVLFQGATARNKALIAAFEQHLGQPIHVSRFCHLTGAIGAALMLVDRNSPGTTFKGLGLCRMRIPIRSEVCEICSNHCKLTIAEVEGVQVAYGFLCGRDYDTPRYVNNNSSGFDLLKARKKTFHFKADKAVHEPFCVGLPAALHMIDDLPFWRVFFDALGIETKSSEDFSDALRSGKRIAEAEFCAPMTAMYGHVQYLLQTSDYVFLPFYMDHENPKGDARRQYCYYTQFAPSLAALIQNGEDGYDERKRVLTPLIYYLYGSYHKKLELLKMLQAISSRKIKFSAVSAAFDKAEAFRRTAAENWKQVYQKETAASENLHVVLLGRPYNILSKTMNKGIPDIFASLGIKVFFQDMLEHDDRALEAMGPLLTEIHWHYAAEIMKSALTVARSKHAYPVLISSFKCSPDSFVIDYFKELMESCGKPYLILQLDEHDSTIGYETRIEAALRSFQNHHGMPEIEAASLSSGFPAIVRKKGMLHKTLVVPNWDTLSLSLVVANLQKEGIDARLMEESEVSIQKSLRSNTGQCIPLNIIAQEFIDYMKAHRLDPARTALWLVKSAIPCNLRLYPSHIQRLLQIHGGGYEKAEMYPGTLSFAEISPKLPIATYFAYMFGGMVKKIGCRIRPYEKIKGSTDGVIQAGLEILKDAFLGNQDKADAAEKVVSLFEGIETCGPASAGGVAQTRPKVAIFGDLYARDNEVINQDLIHFIEKHGGEVVTTPYSAYVKMIAKPYLRKWFVEGSYLNALSSRALIAAVTHLEKKYYKYFNRILKDPEPDYDDSPVNILSPYRIRIEHTGESMDNILKIFYTIRHYPGIALFVQTSPAFCCPSLVTEAMAGEIERKTGVPIVSVTYDGTGGDKNDIIIPYLKYPRIRNGR